MKSKGNHRTRTASGLEVLVKLIGESASVSIFIFGIIVDYNVWSIGAHNR